MICTTCGRDNADHLVFCQECGQRLRPRVAPPTPPVGLPQQFTAPVPVPVPTTTQPLTAPQPAPQAALAPMPSPSNAPVAVRPQAPDFRFAARGEGAAPPSKPPASLNTVKCVMCGSGNQRGLRFCVTCGHPLASAREGGGQGPEALAPPAPMTPAALAAPPPPPRLVDAAPSMPIAPSRVVDIGAAPPSKAPTRACPRCRGTCDANAQFCKFCGASLADPTPPVAVPASSGRGTTALEAAPSAPRPLPPPPQPPQRRALDRTEIDPNPPSFAPDTPAVDESQYRPYQAMAATAPPPPVLVPSADSAASTKRESDRPTMAAPQPASAPGPTRGRLVVIARDGGEGPSYPLGDLADIGRSEGTIVIAEDRFVSPRHARISRRGDHVFLRDLGSVNGIYLRIPSGLGAALTSQGSGQAHTGAAAPLMLIPEDAAVAVPLQDQDLFLVGQQVLRFEVVRDAEEGFGSASQHGTLLFGTPGAPRYARLSQRTVEGVTRDVFYIRKLETVLGRESGDIVFTEDPFLSRRHAMIKVDREPKRFSLCDLGSSNGTFLQIREEVRLKDGDHFRIGQQLFRIDLEARAGGAGSPRPGTVPGSSGTGAV